MSFAAILRRSLLAVLGAILFVGATVVGVLAYPEPLYAYGTEAGRLRLYSDRPFDPARGQAVLAEVERRLALAPPQLRDPDTTYRVFVTNAEWRKRLVFLWAYGAAGLNLYPLSNGVFIRQSDIDADRVLRPDGNPTPPPRTLAYYASHEIGHGLIGRHVGAFANQRLPAWVREGLADYIGLAGDIDIDALARSVRAEGSQFDPRSPDPYARYRLLVAFFLEREGWTIDRLLASRIDLGEAQRLFDAANPGAGSDPS